MKTEKIVSRCIHLLTVASAVFPTIVIGMFFHHRRLDR